MPCRGGLLALFLPPWNIIYNHHRHFNVLHKHSKLKDTAIITMIFQYYTL